MFFAESLSYNNNLNHVRERSEAGRGGTGKKLKFPVFINTVLADLISLLAGAIQQKPVIPAFRGA